VNVSEVFIRRPIATTLLTIAIALAGGVSYFFLPISPLPQVEFPTIQVSAGLPGASPETMASSVATPLERQFGRIAGLTEMTSASQLGSTQVVLQFDLSRDIDGAARDVQAAINAARSQLPANLPNNPNYRKVNPSDAPIVMLALTSDTATRAQMYDVASSVLQQRIAQVDGVGQVFVGGGALPAVRVEVNPTALAARGLGLETLRAFLSSANANRPKGELGGERRSWSLATTDQLYKANDYKPLVVSYINGAAVRLDDVSNVVDSVEDIRTGGSANGRPAVLLIVSRQPGANIIAAVDGIRSLLPVLQAAIPQSMTLSVLSDRTTTIRASVHDIQIAMLISIGLVIVVVFVFLRSARYTLIPAVVVPVSLIGTLAAMYLCGYSLDNLSLMALTIATGFVVDDAIVVIENVSRHVDAGVAPLDAALIGAREIGFTVISISLSLVAVFIPILLMSGIVGRLFREFAVTLSIAILVSMVVSLTATPMMCARLLRARPLVESASLTHPAGDWIDGIRDRYQRSLIWVLGHRQATLAVTVATMLATGFLYVRVAKGFFPQQDTGALNGTVQADEDTSFQAMQQRVSRFVDIVRRDPAVATVLAYVGGGGVQNSARMFVNLKPRGERDADATAIISRIRRASSTVPGAVLYLQAAQDLRVGGRASQAQFQYTVQSDDVSALNQWAPRLYDRLKKLPILADVNSDLLTRGLQASLTIDRGTASRLGITAQTIDNTLYDAFGQRPVSTMFTSLNQYHVVMEVAPEFWQRPDGLRDIYVSSDTGDQVPLAALAQYAPSTAPLAVNHQGQVPSVTISFNLPSGIALGQAVDAITSVERDMGIPPSVRGSFQGTAQAYEQSLAAEPWLIAAALAAVYVVLGVLYESYVHPLTILSTLPSAGVGALVALMLCRTELTIIALVGIILLIGIVKKNAILMIDFALDAERNGGRTPEDAILQACVLRFRPIVMTTMAALFGALPLAIGFGIGAELRRPLGIAIVGGLIFSQLLTLYTTPVVYLYLDRLRRWHARPSRAISGVRLNSGTAFRTCVVSIALGVLCAGCTVGPAYKRPPVAVPAAFKEQAAPPDGQVAQWRPAQPQDDVLRGKWWEAFGDPLLNSLEEQVAVSNVTVAETEARFRAARAAVGEARASLFPTVTVGANAQWSRTSTDRTTVAPAAGSRSVYQLPIDVSYEADVWGRVRRTIEASRATAQASGADVQTALLSSRAELAVDYFELRGLDAEVALLRATAVGYERALQLTQARYAQGIVSGVDVAQAQTQLDTTRVQLTDRHVARAQFEHAIAILVGRPPADVDISEGAITSTPPAVPTVLPSELMERRPDIAAAERRVAAANAQIGVAQAAFFPSLSLTAGGGVASSAAASLLTLPSGFWAIGPALLATVFDGGRRRAVKAEAVADYDGAVATYRESTLTAFQDVEDNLAALRVLSDEVRQADDAVTSADRALTIANSRYVGGVTTYLEVVTAQATLLSNRITAADIVTRQMTATVRLIKALGGGWSTADLPRLE